MISNSTSATSVISIALSDVSPISYPNISQAITDSSNSGVPYPIEIVDDQSYVLSLPDNLTHNVTMSPGQSYSLDSPLPCIVDSFGTEFNACNISDITLPSWAAIN